MKNRIFSLGMIICLFVCTSSYSALADDEIIEEDESLDELENLLEFLEMLDDYGFHVPILEKILYEWVYEDESLEDGKTEEKMKYEITGEDVLSEDNKTLLINLLDEFNESLGETEFELKFSVKKQDGVLVPDFPDDLSFLTEEQENLWMRIQENVTSFIENSDGDDVELVIEFEHEYEFEQPEEEVEEPEVEIEEEEEEVEEPEVEIEEEETE
jgi:hypothetical protein